MLAMEFAVVTTQAANQEGKNFAASGKIEAAAFLARFAFDTTMFGS
jgi:hypothetical protein